MRIGIDCRWIRAEQTGVSLYARELTRSLAALDTGHTLVLVFSNSALEEAVMDEMRCSGRTRFVSTLVPWGVYSMQGQALMPRWLHESGLDVFHSVDHVVPYMAFPTNSSGRTKLVVTVHDVVPLAIPDSSPRSRKHRAIGLYRFLVGELGRRASAIVADSDAAARDIRRFVSGSAVLTRVYCGVSGRFRPLERDQWSTHDTLSAAKTILYVGRSDPYKGLVHLVEALAHLRRTCGPTVRLVIAGPSDSRYPEARRRAAELQLMDSIRWTGYLSDESLLTYYQSADLLVMPSRYEGFGLPVLEAMACGTPVVASDIPVLREVAGDAAQFFRVGIVAELAGAMERVLGDRQLRNALRERGMDRAREFTWARAAREMLEVYEGVAGGTVSSRAWRPSASSRR